MGLGIKLMIKGFLNRHSMAYAPKGWQTPVKQNPGWNSQKIIEHKKKEFGSNCFRNDEFYAQALLKLSGRRDISILDFGGGFGHYYQVSRSILPKANIDFHCFEVKGMVEIGRRLNPDIHWYEDESFLGRTYDFVLVNGSLQYFEDWPKLLEKLSRVTRDYLCVSRISVVEKSAGFVVLQTYCGAQMLEQHFNRDDLLKTFETIGMQVVSEAIVEDSTEVRNAPEPYRMKGWLLKKKGRSG